jgi:hypothetical protein
MWNEIVVIDLAIIAPHGTEHTAVSTILLASCLRKIIETHDQPFEGKDIHPIGTDTLNLMVGDQVTFAVTKNTVCIRDAKDTSTDSD